MALFRLFFMICGGAFLACMAMYTLSGEPIWRQRAMQVLRWLVVAVLLLIGLFVLRRGAMFI